MVNNYGGGKSPCSVAYLTKWLNGELAKTLPAAEIEKETKGAAYLGSNLIYIATSVTDIGLRAGTTYLAKGAVLYTAAQKRTLSLHFRQAVPPREEAGSLATESDVELIVPSDYLLAYRNALPSHINQLYTPDEPIPGLRVFKKVTPLTNGAQAVSVQKFFDPANTDKTAVPTKVLDINSLLAVYGAFDLYRIKASAFYNNPRLEEIILPPRLGTIGSYAFNYCAELKKLVIMGAENPPTIQSDTFTFSTLSKSFRIYVDKSKQNAYTASLSWPSTVKSYIVYEER